MFFNNIITFLKGGLPFFTELFSNNIAINTIVFDGIHATISTINPHNLIIGNYCIVKKVKYIYPINSIVYNSTNGILTGNIGNSHQVYKNDISLDVEGDFNGKATLLNLDNDNNIRLCLPKSLTINNLSIVKILNRYINDYFRVDDVIDNLTFKILYDTDIGQIVANGQVVSESRVDGGYNINDYASGYLKHHSEFVDFIYVEYVNNEISRSNASSSDFNQSMQKYTDNWITNRDNINIYYISNTTNESSKSQFANRGSREVRDAILKVLQNNSEIDIENGFNLTYDGGSIQNINEGQTNFSVFQYNFYLQFTFSTKLEYNRDIISRIQNINFQSTWNQIPKECK